MEGMKFDRGKAMWELVPAEYLTKLASSIKPFIEMYMLKDKEIKFDKSYIYNIVRANIIRWRQFGPQSQIGQNHPLMNAMIGILMLAKTREYSYDEVFTEIPFQQRWDLIDPEWTTNIVEIYSYGAAKYEKNNWMKVESDRYYAALNRHIEAFWNKKTYDDESGFLHLYHAAWNCITLQWLEKKSERNEIVSNIPPVILKAANKMRGVNISIKTKKIKK